MFLCSFGERRREELVSQGREHKAAVLTTPPSQARDARLLVLVTSPPCQGALREDVAETERRQLDALCLGKPVQTPPIVYLFLYKPF